MKNLLCDEISKIKSKGLTDLHVLGLITNTSYEIIFYVNYDGIIMQSNTLAEEGFLSIGFVDELYASIAKVVRGCEQFDPDKMNIITVEDEKVTIKYDEKSCRVYDLKKRWKESIGL